MWPALVQIQVLEIEFKNIGVMILNLWYSSACMTNIPSGLFRPLKLERGHMRLWTYMTFDFEQMLFEAPIFVGDVLSKLL